MLDIVGESLGKRQAELNTKVNEAVNNKVNFEDIKNLQEKCDVDKLFKIDIAAKYKIIDYIVDVFKCGDSVYVSRVLNQDSIYDDDLSTIINPGHLDSEIFPHMSLRMKKKLLESVASHVRNNTRLNAFFEYSVRSNMPNLAFKFSLFLSESNKVDIINNHFKIVESQKYELFIGSSFTLAEAYISKLPAVCQKIVMKLHILFLKDPDRYLDLLEKHYKHYSTTRFGARISKSIMTKYKHRVLSNPVVYIHTLHIKVFVRHSTSEDAKIYVTILLPETTEKFWMHNLYSSYKYIFDVIPKSEIYQFYKKVFIEKYQTDLFELHVQFYHFNYFELLTEDEREFWALKHIEIGGELLGPNKDYIWYRYVNYDLALPEIKKYILVTNDKDVRNDMCKILVHSARNQRHLENLFNYYYERHVNETVNLKKDFVDTVHRTKNILEFDEACWTPLNKILYSLEIYTPGFYGLNTGEFREFCICYHILNNIEMPEALLYHIRHVTYVRAYEPYVFQSCHEKVTDAKWTQIYEKLFEIYYNDINEINNRRQKGGADVDDINKEMLENVFYFLLFLEFFNRTKDDIPVIIFDFILQNFSFFRSNVFFKKEREEQLKNRITEKRLLRLLKVDKNLLFDRIPDIFDTLNENKRIRLAIFVKKLKIYFSNDAIVQEFIMFFQKCLDEATKDYDYYRVIKTAVYGLFQLADDDYKVNLMSKYVPVEAKIDHDNIERDLLSIQEAICRHVGYSRPPVPLSSVLNYIKGDYIHFCLPMFNMYMVNLPLPKSMQFIDALLDTPISIQKHAIRSAFKMYSPENLGKLISKIWQRSKNVSLRMIIYKALFAKIKDLEGDSQRLLFELIKTFTKTLHEDDQDEVYELIESDKMSDHLRGEYLQTAWKAIKFLSSKKKTNMKRKIMIVRTIERNNALMNKEFMRTEIIENFLEEILDEDGLAQEYNSQEDGLHQALWQLTKTYIYYVRNEKELIDSRNLLQNILQSCFEFWECNYKEDHKKRKFIRTFLDEFKSKCCNGDDALNDQKHTISLLELCSDNVQKSCPHHEVYLLVLGLKLTIATRRVLSNFLTKLDEIARCFVAEVIPLLDDMHKKRVLCKIFLSNISSQISECIGIMASYHNNDVVDILTIHVCIELLGVNRTTSLLALSLMPYYPSPSGAQELTDIFFNELKKINDFEVQSYYNDMFFTSSFHVGCLLEFDNDSKKTFDNSHDKHDTQKRYCNIQ